MWVETASKESALGVKPDISIIRSCRIRRKTGRSKGDQRIAGTAGCLERKTAGQRAIVQQHRYQEHKGMQIEPGRPSSTVRPGHRPLGAVASRYHTVSQSTNGALHVKCVLCPESVYRFDPSSADPAPDFRTKT